MFVDNNVQVVEMYKQDIEMEKLVSQIKQIEKTELHLHLGGAWPLEWLKTVGDRDDVKRLESMLQKIANVMDYHEAFAVFGLVNKIVNTDEKVRAGAVALCKQLRDDNVTYVEIRTGLKDLGSGFEGYLQAVLDGIKEGCQGTCLKADVVLSLRRSSSAEIARQTFD